MPSQYSIDSNEPRFTLFPQLPIELRLKIWKYALPGPRIITIDLNYCSCNDIRPPEPFDRARYVRCRAECPAMLHVNSEAEKLHRRSTSHSSLKISAIPSSSTLKTISHISTTRTLSRVGLFGVISEISTATTTILQIIAGSFAISLSIQISYQSYIAATLL
jgi:hypothetical protein